MMLLLLLPLTHSMNICHAPDIRNVLGYVDREEKAQFLPPPAQQRQRQKQKLKGDEKDARTALSWELGEPRRGELSPKCMEEELPGRTLEEAKFK